MQQIETQAAAAVTLDEHGDFIVAAVESGPAVEDEAEAEAYEYEDSEEEQVIFDDPFAEDDPFDDDDDL